MEAPFWDSGYSDLHVSTMGGPSHEVIVLGEALERLGLARRRVLDLGSGEGRNSLFLGSLGHSVTAVDVSERAVSKLRFLSARMGGNVIAEQSKLEEWPISLQYDIIMAHGSLHFVGRENLLQLIPRLQSATSAGGAHVFTLALFDDGVVIPEFLASGHTNPLANGELLSFYKDWELVLFESYRKWDWHPGLGGHDHPIEKWIFFKPGGIRIPIRSTRVPKDEKRANSIREMFSGMPVGSRQSLVEKGLGLPDRTYKFKAGGLQLSSTQMSARGYELTLLRYESFLFYIVDSTVVGKAEHYLDFCELEIAAPSE